MISKITKTIKDMFGDDNEFVASFDMAIKERITSPFYGYFVVSWLVVNWKVIYVAFFIGQDQIFKKTNLLRHDYLSSIFPGFLSWGHWWHFLFLPLLLTVLFFWVFPIVTRFFYRKSLRNQKKLKIIEIEETTQQTKEEKILVKEERKLIKEKVEKAKEVKKAEKESPEVLWQQEFNEFKKHSFFMKLKEVTEIVYSRGGRTYTNINGRWIKSIEASLLALLDTKNLIIIRGTGIMEERIELTPKGKFFISKFMEMNDR